MKNSTSALICTLLLASASCEAASIGRNRGGALIGRPLDISVQATLDAGEDLSTLCLEADVFQADTKIPNSRVRVTAEKSGAGPQDALIRIRSAALIEEPVLIIYLRAGCQQKTERRFVVLADLVSDPVGGVSVTPPVVGPADRQAAGSGGDTGRAAAGFPPAAGRSSQGGSNARGARRAQNRAAAAPRSEGASPSAPADPGALPLAGAGDMAGTQSPKGKPSTAARVDAKNKARLKLEPLDLTVERSPELKASAELLSVPTTNTQERTVAAALWKALSLPPQDALRDTDRIQALENEIRTLRVQAKANQAALDTLNTELQRAKSERYANALVYALGALLLLALAALIFVWRKRTVAPADRPGNVVTPWWRRDKSVKNDWSHSLRDADGERGGPGRRGHSRVPSNLGPLDLDLGGDQSSFTEFEPLHGDVINESEQAVFLRRDERADFTGSLTNPSRAVNAEELFDVQQQADFFVSLGQYEQAIDVLRSHINDNGQTSALVYLDLFNLYHHQRRQVEYEELRAVFNQRFNATIPAFEMYSDGGPGLEAYQAAMSRIQALWPSPKVLEVIEESIFRKPDSGTDAFDLEAYRELLLLYAVAKEVISPEDSVGKGPMKFELPASNSLTDGFGDKSSKFLPTAMQPLSSKSGDVNQISLSGGLSQAAPRPSPRLGLDVDLTEGAPEGGLPVTPVGVETDTQFFSRFSGTAPVPLTASPPWATSAAPDEQGLSRPDAEAGNLIDFDVFDSSAQTDEPTLPIEPPKASKKSKTPKQ